MRAEGACRGALGKSARPYESATITNRRPETLRNADSVSILRPAPRQTGRPPGVRARLLCAFVSGRQAGIDIGAETLRTLPSGGGAASWGPWFRAAGSPGLAGRLPAPRSWSWSWWRWSTQPSSPVTVAVTVGGGRGVHAEVGPGDHPHLGTGRGPLGVGRSGCEHHGNRARDRPDACTAASSEPPKLVRCS